MIYRSFMPALDVAKYAASQLRLGVWCTLDGVTFTAIRQYDVIPERTPSAPALTPR